MKRIIVVFLIVWQLSFGAYTELYVQSTASNLNAGSSAADAAAFTYTSAVLAAGWNQSTGVFTVASGTPNSDMPTMADGTHFASVYVTSGATVATFVGRVTAVSATTITVSLTAVSGTPPATDALGATTLKVDGAWAGPSGTVGFPFGFVAGAQVNSTGSKPRVNFKNGVTYSVTAAVTHNINGNTTFQGYTTSAGDGGKAVLDGGTSGAAYTMLTISGTDIAFIDFIFAHNGGSGGGSATQGVTPTGVRCLFVRCVFHDFRAAGLYAASAQCFIIECEAYGNNISNTTARAGIYAGVSGALLVRCISHDSAGTTNGHGIGVDQSVAAIDCITDSNPGSGFFSQADQFLSLINCDSYNNGADGLLIAGAAGTLVCNFQNCNFIKNGGLGINSSGNAVKSGVIYNCGFGSGSQANAGGQMTTIAPVQISGTITYASGVTPWVDPANGDFRINLPAAQGAGAGNFTQTASSYAGTIAYPDVGAAQHKLGQISSGGSN